MPAAAATTSMTASPSRPGLEVERQVEVDPHLSNSRRKRRDVLGQVGRGTRRSVDAAGRGGRCHRGRVRRPVGGQPDVALETAGSELQGDPKRLDRVLRRSVPSTTVGESDRRSSSDGSRCCTTADCASRVEPRDGGRPQRVHTRSAASARSPTGGPMTSRRTDPTATRATVARHRRRGGVGRLTVTARRHSIGASDETSTSDERRRSRRPRLGDEPTSAVEPSGRRRRRRRPHRRRGSDDARPHGVSADFTPCWLRSARATRATSCWPRCRSAWGGRQHAHRRDPADVRHRVRRGR